MEKRVVGKIVKVFLMAVFAVGYAVPSFSETLPEKHPASVVASTAETTSVKTTTGESAPQVMASEAVNQVYKLKTPISNFYGAGAVDLRCSSESVMVSIPIPDRWNVKSANLTVNYTQSSALIPAISLFAVRIGNKPLFQKKPDPEELTKTVTAPIPPNMLKASYNEFVFEASQHFQTSKECERPCDPALWTKVNLAESFLELEYALKPVPLNLGKTDFIFDPKLITGGRVNMVLDGIKDDNLSIAGTVASGVAKRFTYRKVAFTVSDDVVPGYDNILLGDAKFVARILDRYKMAIKTDSTLIKVMHLPDHLEPSTGENSGKLRVDPTHALLILTADNAGHLKIASSTFASMTFPYPGTDEMVVQKFNIPEITLYSGKNIISTEKIYKFNALGFKTHTFRGIQPQAKSITFRLPVDFLIRQNDYAKVTLAFSYTAGVRPDSVLNVFLNDRLVRSIALSNPTGDLLTGYKMDFPTFLFKPGTNVLTFAPILTPLAKECELLQPESFSLTLFENSTFFLPAMPHLIELPQMELFAINGFPFTRWPDGYGSRIFLPNADKNTVAAAFNIIGLITQLNGYPLLAMEVTTENLSNYQGELMVIGDAKSIPDNIWADAPLKLGRVSQAPYPATTNWESAKATSFVETTQISGIGRENAALMQFQSPFKKGHSVLLVTAETTANVKRLSEAMSEPSVLANIAGDLDIIDLATPDYLVNSMNFQKKYLTGEKGEVSGLDAFLFTNTWIYYALVLVLILVPTAILYIGAKRIIAKREKAGESKVATSTAGKIFDFLKRIFLRKGK